MSTDRCAAGERCVRYDRREKLAGEVEDGPLCEGELQAAERAVPALVLDYRDLEQHIPPSMGERGDGLPRGTGEARVPMNLAAEALQAEIHRILTTWEEVLRDVDRLSVPEPAVWSHWSAPNPRVVPGVDVQRAARILAPRIRLLARIQPVTLADYPDIDDDQAHRIGTLIYSDVPGWRGVLDFIRLHQRASQQLGLTAAKPEVCQGVACKQCDLMNVLVREPGSEDIVCGHCHHRYTAHEYRIWVGLLDAAVQQSQLR